MIDIAWGAATHTGRRARNEDSYLANPPLFAVADGMGGHAAGDVASRMAVDALERAAASLPLTRPSVLGAIRDADRSIHEHAATASSVGMGTTLCGVAFTGGDGSDQVVVFNVGDSRAYRLRGALLERLTHDHSVVQELIDAGRLQDGKEHTHPERHVITRSLGSDELLEIDWVSQLPHAGDRYLVTSDGLTKELRDEAIADLLRSGEGPQPVADLLVEHTVSLGARDNVTVVVVDVLAVRPGPTSHQDHLDGDTNPRARRSNRVERPGPGGATSSPEPAR